MNSNPSQLHEGILAFLYDAAGHDSEVSLDELDVGALAADQLLWVDLTGASAAPLPKEMRSALGRSDERLEIFDHFYRFAIPLREAPDECLRFAVGRSWVLTASKQRPRFFDEFIEADQGETLKGKMTSSAFMASLLMRHLDGFREEIAGVDLAIDKRTRRSCAVEKSARR